MNAINALLTTLTDACLSPLARWPAWLPLVLVSAVAGVLMSIVFRFTSRQDLLRRDAERIQAQLLAMKLFKDDFGTMSTSLGRLLRHTGDRLWHSLPPVLVMTAPFVLLLVQLARWYEHTPLVAGDQAVVELHLAEDAWLEFRDIGPQPTSGVVIETPSLRDAEERSLYWRVRIEGTERASLRWQLGQEMITKPLSVADRRERLVAIDVRRPGSGWLERLSHPGEPPLSVDSPAQAIAVHYPPRTTPILGMQLPWWATFLILSIVAAVVVRPLVNVQF